jgi:hypothetical protein
VGLLAGNQELGGVSVGVERVGGDHRAGEVEPVQQWLERGDLFGRAADQALGEHRAAGMLPSPEQVHRAAVAIRHWGVGAAQRLAIDRHRPLPWSLPLAGASAVAAVMALAVGQPGADGAGQRLGVQARHCAADGGLGRHGELPGDSTAAAAMARMATREWRRPRVARGSGTAAR